jgi:hypothetical protein
MSSVCDQLPHESLLFPLVVATIVAVLALVLVLDRLVMSRVRAPKLIVE